MQKSYYAINGSGRQKLSSAQNLHDVIDILKASPYYQTHPPTKIIEQIRIEFDYPGDFE